MGRLLYAVICSLDGCTVDAEGNFDWAAPGAEVHAATNDLERQVGTALYGRRVYETARAPQPGNGQVLSRHRPVERS